MSASSDRNLVFGLLALQMDFVSREQLLDAMQAWLLTKQTPLGEILCARGMLNEQDRAALECLVDRHVQRHGGEQGSLQALRVNDGVGQSLVWHGDGAIKATITTLPSPSANGDDGRRFGSWWLAWSATMSEERAGQ